MTYNLSKHILTNEREETLFTIREESRWVMMPLTMAEAGREIRIRKIGGKDETRRFLESLGFVIGGFITVVSEINGNLIVKVKDSRVAISKEMANRIFI